MKKHIILGLGNPGKEYEKTRHNAGWLALDALAARYAFPKFAQDKHLHASVSGLPFGDTLYLLVKPDTFMNKSGLAAQAILQYYKLEPTDLTVIYDDIDIPLGTIRHRAEGSAGTHNGMRSVIQEVGTQGIERIRLGIQPDHPITDLSSFVLGRLSAPEMVALEKVFEEIALPLEAQSA